MSDIDPAVRRTIVALELENVHRLKAVRLKPNEHVTVIGGHNGQGKSSLLAGIAIALAGRRVAGVDPIRHGEDSSSMFLDLGDITVTRKLRRSGNDSLVVKPKEGSAIRSGQALLDALTKKTCFDPLAFANEEPKKQAAQLRELTGLDFTEIDEDIARIEEERTEKGREVRRLEGAVALLAPLPADLPKEAPDVTALRASLGEHTAKQAAVDATLEKLTAAQAQVLKYSSALNERKVALQNANDEIDEAEKALTALKENREKLKAAINKGSEYVTEARNAVAAVEAEIAKARAAVPDVSAIVAEIERLEQVGKQVKVREANEKLRSDLRATKATYDEMDKSIDSLRKSKEQMLKEAKLPVEGLSFTGLGVFYNGTAFQDASDAEKIRVSIAISAAMNPSLPVMFIKQGSLLDDKTMDLVIKLAEEMDLQLLVERVARDRFVSVIIEDGERVE